MIRFSSHKRFSSGDRHARRSKVENLRVNVPPPPPRTTGVTYLGHQPEIRFDIDTPSRDVTYHLAFETSADAERLIQEVTRIYYALRLRGE